MATYYSSSSDQRDVMPTLYLRDAGRSTYQGSSHPGDMVYLNYSSAGPYSDALAGNSQSHQNNCVELPVPTGMLSQDSSAGASDSTTSHQGILSNLVAPRIGEQAYGIWRDGRNETLFMHPTSTLPTMQSIGGSINNTDDLVRQTVTESPQMDFRAQLGILHSANNLQLQRSDISPNAQGLSLSLSTQIPSGIPVPSFQYRNSNTEISFVGSRQSTSGDGGSCRDDNSLSKQSGNVEFSHAYSGRDRAMHVDTSPYGLSGLSGTISNSKYLKAAQQLLDEVVNVRKALRQESDKHQSLQVSTTGLEENDDGSKGSSMLPSSGMPVNPQESTDNSSELSAAERQDLQNKMAKLLAMLDEVDRRYKQYYHQMQIVVSSFDVIAGCGAAKPYTALALQTISRHFRCLRDAISSQIKEARKSLGEPDTSSGKGGGLSRLRFVDQQLRQQRALQQIGMIQQHAWRPQRGLPESSVSILRAWLFEHFLHPYPKDSDKIMLARQTGLTRSQVSNWFINARVRLWKPMVEEMYKEEIGDVEMDSNSSSENAPKAKEGVRTSEEREELQESMKAMTHTSQFGDSKPIHISDVEMAATAACFHNVGSGEETDFGNLKSREQTTTSNACSLLQDTIVQSDGSGRFMAYPMAELGRFGNGGVSLTLGLQHCDGGPPISGGQQNLVAVREDEIYGAASGADAADYNCMNLGNQPHRFGSSRLLHDFVA